MLSSTGETVLAVVGGVASIAIGLAVWRFREPYYRLTMRWQRTIAGDRVATRTARSIGPRGLGLIGLAFVGFGLALVLASPWVSRI